MKITIQIDTSNAAFQPDWQPEVKRIMERATEELSRGQYPSTPRDYNGNKVGYIKLEMEEVL